MNDIIYYIWLSLCFPAGSYKLIEIVNEFDNLQVFYENYNKDKNVFQLLDDKDIERLNSVSLEKAERIIEKCKTENAAIITIKDADYPDNLRNIPNPPIVLYIKGSIKGLDDELTLTMVGTRRPSEYSNSVTGNMAFQLARAGAVIVSGCAEGLDTLAHLGALKANGMTVGILACGIDVDYPKSNNKLKEAIIQKGALVTELPPGIKSGRGYFHARNRIMSGISTATIVTQASIESGALITARHAIEQGRDVFCVPPHDIYDADYKGISDLYSQGACYMAVSAKYILDTYSEPWGHKLNLELATSTKMTEKEKSVTLPEIRKIIVAKRPKWEETEPNTERKKPKNTTAPDSTDKNVSEPISIKTVEKPSGLNDSQQDIWKAISKNNTHPNDIAAATNLDIRQIATELSMMEIMGYIKKNNTGRYQLTVDN